MLIRFFETVREHRVPATLRELLDLYEAMGQHLAYASLDDFYNLSRATLVKDEKYYDRFDRAFDAYFKGLDSVDPDWFTKAIPEEWLRKQLEKNLSPEEFEKLKGMGSLEKLMEEFQKRLAEQHKRHQGETRQNPGAQH